MDNRAKNGPILWGPVQKQTKKLEKDPSAKMALWQAEQQIPNMRHLKGMYFVGWLVRKVVRPPGSAPAARRWDKNPPRRQAWCGSGNHAGG